MFRCAVALTGVLLSVAAQAAPLTYSLTVDGTKLGGTGAPVLRDAMADAQFILYSEDHGFADSPIVLRAITREARPLGFKYHVVEVGPVSVRIIDRALAQNGLAGVHEIVHEAPLAVPFLSLKNDAELASDFGGADANGTPYLWDLYT